MVVPRIHHATLPPSLPPTGAPQIVKVSASFGADIWDALNYGQVMYAIRTRNGNVYMRLEKRYGDMTALEVRSAPEA